MWTDGLLYLPGVPHFHVKKALNPLRVTASVLRQKALWDCSELFLSLFFYWRRQRLRNRHLKKKRCFKLSIALNISSRSIRQMLAIISGVEFVQTVWFVQLQPNKFQRFFKDKLQFSRTDIYSINRHSLTPLWTHNWLKHVHVMHVILFKYKNINYVTRELNRLRRGWARFSLTK